MFVFLSNESSRICVREDRHASGVHGEDARIDLGDYNHGEPCEFIEVHPLFAVLSCFDVTHSWDTGKVKVLVPDSVDSDSAPLWSLYVRVAVSLQKREHFCGCFWSTPPLFSKELIHAFVGCCVVAHDLSDLKCGVLLVTYARASLFMTGVLKNETHPAPLANLLGR